MTDVAVRKEIPGTGGLESAMGSPTYHEDAVRGILCADMPVATLFLDNRLALHGFNRGYAEILARYGLSVPEPGKGVAYFDCMPESTSRLKPMLTQTLDRGEPVVLSNVKLESALEGKTVTTFWDSYHAPVVNGRGEVRGVLAFIQDLTPRTDAEARVRQLEGEVAELKSALRAVIKLKNEDKDALEAQLAANVRHLVLPLLDELKGACLTGRQQELFRAAESGLVELTSPFVDSLASAGYGLTPREIRIAHLVKEGKTTKEIARLLCVSTGSVSTHRHHLRKKLGLTHRHPSLREFLQKWEEEQ